MPQSWNSDVNPLRHKQFCCRVALTHSSGRGWYICKSNIPRLRQENPLFCEQYILLTFHTSPEAGRNHWGSSHTCPPRCCSGNSHTQHSPLWDPLTPRSESDKDTKSLWAREQRLWALSGGFVFLHIVMRTADTYAAGVKREKPWVLQGFLMFVSG